VKRTNALVALRVFAVILFLIGLGTAIGGLVLLRLGGSPYYLLSGLSLTCCSVLVWLRKPLGILVYAATLLVTLGWAFWEVGLDGWALMPRLLAPIVLGAILWALWKWFRAATMTSAEKLGSRGGWAAWTACVVAVAVAIAIGEIGHNSRTDLAIDPVYQAGLGKPSGEVTPLPASAPANGDWPAYGGDLTNTRFSPLAKINADNVAKLKVAWTYRIGPTPAGHGEPTALEVTPLKIGDTVYVCTAYNDVIALDAETGRERWRYRSNIDLKDVWLPNCRGVAYFRSDGPDCPERIITATVSAELIAIDARTGVPCAGFGSNGRVSLLDAMGQTLPGYYFVSSAPIIVRGNIVVGGAVYDNQYWGEPSGVIRAFDATTGSLKWAWDMGRPDRHGLPPPGETYTLSTPNAWAPMSADEQLGLVYAPLGNSEPDIFGAQRRPFDDQYGTAVVALDALTGELRWSFQTVHHDLWDYDVASPPTLVDIPTSGGVEHALIQPTKTGEIFVLDRRTGAPLSAVEERPAPQTGAAPEERLAATQPYSVKMPSMSGPTLSEQDMWGLTPLDQLWCRIQFKEFRYDGRYTPPGVTPSLEYPGTFGGSSWGGVSVDVAHGMMIFNTLRLASFVKLIPRAEADKMGIKPMEYSKRDPKKKTPAHGGFIAQAGTPYAVQIGPFQSPLGIPCQRPPYGVISAVDLRTHALLWTQPFGTAREAGPRGRHSHIPLTMGVPQQGGSLATGAGLIFIGASMDRYFRAFSSSTGQLLWEDQLPTSGNASPMTYLGPRSGRQFVVIAAGGSKALLSPTGDYIIAYALP
jgi:membrane-bound PQQ-dependent dehydrogenase (glucose/quinate/shikimate family)